jgi:hypothetical protein
METHLGIAGLLLLLCAGPALAAKPVAPALEAARPLDKHRAAGAAAATAEFAAGRLAYYFWLYSNMPNGPDDPVEVAKRELMVAVVEEKGIEVRTANSGCIIDPELDAQIYGYNEVADRLLKARFGASYQDDIRKEVERRMALRKAVQ